LESSPAVRLAATAAALLLTGVTAWVIRRSRGAGGGTRASDPPVGLTLDLEVSAVLLLTLACSPISWSHHYVLALIPLWTVVAAAGRWSLSARATTIVSCAAGLAFLLIARKPHPDLFDTGAARVALSASLLGALLLWGACLFLLSHGPARAQRRHEVARAA